MNREGSLINSTINVHRCFSEAKRELIIGNSSLRTRLEQAFVHFALMDDEVPEGFENSFETIRGSREQLPSMSVDDLQQLARWISEFQEALTQFMDESPKFADFSLVAFLDGHAWDHS